MIYAAALAAVTVTACFVVFARTVLRVVELNNLERDRIDAEHTALIEHLCNRIQLPERTAHNSVSNSAPDREPTLDPDLEFEELIAQSGE